MTEAADRWNARYRDLAASEPDHGEAGDHRIGPPGALLRFEDLLPGAGVAVDLAGGPGGCALHLAARGLTAVVLDISDVALAIAERRAAAAGGPLVTIQADLEDHSLGSALAKVRGRLPEAEITLVSCFHYLNRRLLATVAKDLPPGAVFAASIATIANLQRNARPPRRFLLEPGELFRLVVGGQAEGLEVLRSDEGWHDGHHHEADLVVRKPPDQV